MKTLTVPDALDGAHMVKWLKSNGDSFAVGDPLVAFELEGTPKQLIADHAGVLGRIMAKPPGDAVTFGSGAPLAIVIEPGEDIGYESIRSVRIKLRRTCGACGNDYPLNGLVQSRVCPSCRTTENASVAFWTSYVFEDAVEALVKGISAGGSVLAGRHGACKRQCASLLPLCRKCHQLLEWTRFAPVWAAAQAGAPGELACSGCGEIHGIRAAPEWARAAQPGLLGAVGEQGLEATTPAPVRKPVMFTCPQCAAPLKVGGEKRIVTCGHCNVDVRLPDDLWSHFNPVETWERWWLLFDPTVPDRTHDDDDAPAPEPEPEKPTPTESMTPASCPLNVIILIAGVLAIAVYLVWRFTR